MSIGIDFGSRLGPDVLSFIAANAYAMTALDAGLCDRFMARTTNDVKSVRMRWGTVTTPGVIELRIETIDAATGKPTGTLYDAAATKSFTPVAGIQTVSFDTLPTVGLTVGTEYAVVLITTTAGTTQSLNAYNSSGVALSRYTVTLLTTATAVTRSTFTEVVNAVPCLSIIWDDDTEDSVGFSPYTTTPSRSVYGTLSESMKVITPLIINIFSVAAFFIIGAGAPANLRCRIFDSSDNVVSGTTVTLDKDSLTGLSSARTLWFIFPTVVTLPAGTYRIVFDSASSDSSNYWSLRTSLFLDANAVPANYRRSNTVDITASPITWSDSTTDIACVNLLIDSIPTASGGGLLRHPGMSGGMNG